MFNKISRVTDRYLDITLEFMGIVPHDDYLRKAVRTSVNTCMLNSGQTCFAWSRLLVPRDRQGEVVDTVIGAVPKAKLSEKIDALIEA